MAKVKFAPFDASEYLDNEEATAEYLTAALEDPELQLRSHVLNQLRRIP